MLRTGLEGGGAEAPAPSLVPNDQAIGPLFQRKLQLLSSLTVLLHAVALDVWQQRPCGPALQEALSGGRVTVNLLERRELLWGVCL